MKKLSTKIISRLGEEKNIWLASVHPNSKPHLVPVWFIWEDETFFICIYSGSVKFLNISQNESVSIALENGTKPAICEGISERIDRPWPEKIVKKFKKKYDWDIQTDKEYDALIRISPQKWLFW